MRQKKMGRRERLGEIGSKRQEENRRGKCQVRERGREREEVGIGKTHRKGKEEREIAACHHFLVEEELTGLALITRMLPL